ncbi:MAG TPA: 23S rRNA (pseudouridine(1915)-N(3))-methyltransferase RlmH [Bacteroidales bacterium]|nr:23S rRNA (pseudouridine(1915)-N(3))-methyltransferase RlmH [Bacteroidales bacterium]HNS47231.1 23S rRNA (pseudouridine(1915)-N(3))-methyltransferase RlmH [Bacteroidales bacterium]
MKITFIMVGKTGERYLSEGTSLYEQRLRHYISFESITLDVPRTIKSSASADVRSNEARLILRHLQPDDHVILLDEAGTQLSSVELASHLQRLMNSGIRNCVFVSGGPFGFDQAVVDRANDSLSLSRLTFTHQMVRLIFTEQLYRAMTILRNEKYHHDERREERGERRKEK